MLEVEDALRDLAQLGLISFGRIRSYPHVEPIALFTSGIVDTNVLSAYLSFDASKEQWYGQEVRATIALFGSSSQMKERMQ